MFGKFDVKLLSTKLYLGTGYLQNQTKLVTISQDQGVKVEIPKNKKKR
jgi:hypothetical protein